MLRKGFQFFFCSFPLEYGKPEKKRREMMENVWKRKEKMSIRFKMKKKGDEGGKAVEERGKKR